jgi:hypothetical protein
MDLDKTTRPPALFKGGLNFKAKPFVERSKAQSAPTSPPFLRGVLCDWQGDVSQPINRNRLRSTPRAAKLYRGRIDDPARDTDC